MAHLRTQIRNAAAALLTGLATTAANVFPSRRYPLEASSLPALRVYCDNEQSEPTTAMRPRILERTLELVVEGVAADDAALEATLDQIALEVEQAIAGDPDFGGLASHASPISTEIDVDPDLATPHGLIRITFAVTYEARENTPDTVAD